MSAGTQVMEGRVSRRVLRALAAFGLSIDDTIRSHCAGRGEWRRRAARIVSGRARVTAIVGPSGSGKSTLLHEVERLAMNGGERVVRAGRERAGPEQAIVAMPHTTLGEAISLLARVGLAEPRLFGLGPGELSDGQRARYMLALAIRDAMDALRRGAPGGTVWLLIDEFGSGLDVVTARGVASAMARLVRRHAGIRLVVCVHDDRVLPWLEPESTIELSLGGAVRERRTA